MALTSSLSVTLASVLTSTTPAYSTPTDSVLAAITDSLTSGTGIDMADQIYAPAAQTISASSNLDIDLTGSLTNNLGTAIAFARIKGILIKNNTTTVGVTLNVGAGSNPFLTWLIATGDGIKIREDGLFLLWAPDVTAYAVTAGTGDILRITNNSGAASASVSVIIIGATA